MTNYETVKELVQGFAKEVEETKESMWTLTAKITSLHKKTKGVLAAVENLNTSTLPHVEIDWDNLISMAEKAETDAEDARISAESTVSEISETEDNLSSARGEAEDAFTYAESLSSDYSDIVHELERAKQRFGSNKNG